MSWLLYPADENCQEEALAGGKGASLARLQSLGMPVPEFFVVSVSAHRALACGEVGGDFFEELQIAVQRLGGGEQAFAVRSSAVGEDAPDSSFAGLYHTSLEVRGLHSILAAIRDCWDSYDNEAAVEYRQRHATGELGGMAVVVQQMVQAEWAGVCFTADPVQQALSQGVIESTTGLGEALVAGEVNPEEITVRVADGAITKRRPGEKGAPLPDQMVRTVWRQSKAIADALAFPQDVEWAVLSGQVYILQSRPITTIGDIYYSRMLEPWRDANAHPDDPDRIWSRAYADEIWTPPTSPLFYNVQNLSPSFTSYWNWHHEKSPLPPDIFKYHKASPYVDVKILQRMYEYHPGFSRIAGILNFFPSDMQGNIRRAKFRWWGRLRRTLHFELRQRKLRSLARNHAYLAALWPPFLQRTDRWFDLDLDALSLEELRAHQAEVGQTVAVVSPPCGFAVAYHAHDLTFILTGLLERWCGDGDMLYARVTSGLERSETVREAEALWELAASIRALGAQWTKEALDSDWPRFRARLLADASGRRVVGDVESFWRAHRHRGGSYKDLIYPRWGDDIDTLFSVIKGQLQSETVSPSIENARSAEARRQEQRRILSELRGPLAFARRRILRWLFRYNEIYMAERDNHRFYFDRVWYELRRIFLSMGRRLQAAGILEQPQDVFYLGVAEIDSALANGLDGADARRRINTRRTEWARTLRLQAPKFLRGYAPYSDARPNEDGVITGIGASPGVVTGRARVVYDIMDLPSVRDGEILITRQTDPGWTTVFSRIGGLVLETGGVLAHGTSLCREYGLPCVTAVEQATVRIPDGSTIQLGGSDGTIHILKN